MNTLNAYYLNPEIVLFDDSESYLLEKSIPSLSANRLDYTLREVHRYFIIEITEIHAFLESL